MKKILSFALLAAVSASVHASWLFWQVDDTASSNIAYSYAKIKVSGGDITEDTYLTFATVDNVEYDKIMNENASDGDATGAISEIGVDLGKYSDSAYSFAIELYTGDDNLVGWTAPENYSNLPVFTNMGTGGSSSWKPSIVPEPATALLLVLGAALVACRRRVE